MSFLPKRLRDQTGRWSLVDGIPFQLPVGSQKTPALMAAFPINADAAARLLPGNELHPFKLGGRGLLVFTVVDYRETNIGKYVEYSIAIAVTHGAKPAPAFLPLLFQKTFELGQYVFDLPVSSEISVKGGKGIWGMPKHQANLDFIITDTTVSSQYDLDGQLAVNIEIDRPHSPLLPIFNIPGANFCAYRGMLFKSYVYFSGKIGLGTAKKGSARLTIGDHPRVAALKTLEIDPDPVFTAFLPDTHGVLDDHFECWFLSYDAKQTVKPEGMESTATLGLGEEWLTPPNKAFLR
ncbi:MAG: acetoacetate decarboxylase family protein [bacterium]